MPPAMTKQSKFPVVEPVELGQLHELVTRLLQDTDLPGLLQTVLLASLELVGAEKGNVQIYSDRDQTLAITAQMGSQGVLEFSRSVPASISVKGSAFDSRERIILDFTFADRTATSYAVDGFAGLQSTPLFGSDGKLLAVVSTYFRAHRPSERQLRLLDLYLAQAERAIWQKRKESEARAEVDRLALRTADLERENAALARSNREFERFTYLASHDLQEPLRMISLHAQLLATRCAGSLDADGMMFVNRIGEFAARMHELVTDLRVYTELNPPPQDWLRPIDLNLVVETVRRNLKAAIEEKNAVVTCDRLPVVRAHPNDFVVLFQNLIANAIKYRSECPPRVHISVLETDREWRIAVGDNGIGIEPEHHGLIFEAFKRLHGSDIPGSGLGLTICRSVVERYQGRIWVESQAGQGATFVFAIPNA